MDFDTALEQVRRAYDRGFAGEPLPQPAKGTEGHTPPIRYSKWQRCAWWKGFWDYQRFGAIE